jgi:protein gp37
MQQTTIEYLTHTWNPIAMRCTPVSRGCDHCWHLRMAKRLSGIFKGKQEFLSADTNYLRKIAYSGGSPWLNKNELLSAPLRRKKPSVIGVQFMGDLFHNSIPKLSIAAVFGVMAATSQHRYIILTKRPMDARDWFRWADSNVYSGSDRCLSFAQSTLGTELIPIHLGLDGRCPPEKRRPVKWPLENVWLGVSVEDQPTADERIAQLLQIPAAHRLVSYEPALGPLDFSGINGWEMAMDLPPKIDWIIAGAETGPGARPCNPDWLRSVRDQCQAASIPFFLKQVDAEGTRELDGRRWEW